MATTLTLDQIPIGSVLIRPKAEGFVQHRGIYVGDGNVFDNTPETGERISTFAEFAQGQVVNVERLIPLPTGEIYRRINVALRARRPYHLLNNNCDHTLTRIEQGVPRSPQLAAWVIGLSLLGLSAYAAARG